MLMETVSTSDNDQIAPKIFSGWKQESPIKDKNLYPRLYRTMYKCDLLYFSLNQKNKKKIK